MNTFNMFDKDRKGTVLRIEKSSIFDGDGFRTVVFLKGCPMRCQWCSTPESQAFEIESTEEKTYGKIMTVEEVMKEVRKDSLFYFHSGGGLTLSGGEMLEQPEFSLALLKNSIREGINTAVETSLFGKWETIEMLMPYINTLFADLKLVSAEEHKKYCGVYNEDILYNLIKASAMEGNTKIVVRIPVIPGVNDSNEELEKMGSVCYSLKKLDHVQLLPYHKLGTDTYRKLKRPYLLKGVESPTEEEMERCRSIIRKFVNNVI